MGAAPLKPEAAERAMEQFEQYCPGLNQEIRGFADETGVPAENIVFYYSYVQPAGYCSQAAVSTGTGSGSRTYHMRTYDFGWEDAPTINYCSVQPELKASRHIPDLRFNCSDGMTA